VISFDCGTEWMKVSKRNGGDGGKEEEWIKRKVRIVISFDCGKVCRWGKCEWLFWNVGGDGGKEEEWIKRKVRIVIGFNCRKCVYERNRDEDRWKDRLPNKISNWWMEKSLDEHCGQILQWCLYYNPVIDIVLSMNKGANNQCSDFWLTYSLWFTRPRIIWRATCHTLSCCRLSDIGSIGFCWKSRYMTHSRLWFTVQKKHRS
jgi:hypothetical protein